MNLLDYELLDFGEGVKLERFGPKILKRPEASALGRPKVPVEAWQPDSVCTALSKNKFHWDRALLPWQITYGDIRLELRLSDSKNIGIFPEQERNWAWLSKKVRPGANILNLFAYTGGASLVCAKKGAQVCHVDASKAAVNWASKNARLSSLENIRWIVDDAKTFLKREIARNSQYDGLILDPPPFGKAGTLNFQFSRDILVLLELAKQVLKPETGFFLLNSYAVNMKPKELKRLVFSYFGDKQIEAGELKIQELSLSTYARF